MQDDVDKFMELPENNVVDIVLKRLDEQLTKYKFMEFNLNSKRRRLVLENIVNYVLFIIFLILLKIKKKL